MVLCTYFTKESRQKPRSRSGPRAQRPAPGLDKMIPIWYHCVNMKLLNRDVDYAVRALVFMARANKPMISVASMKESVGVTRPFLRKTLQKLHQAGLLHSIKGKGGGFALARRPEAITLSHLMTALQGPLKLNDCVFRKKLCANHDTCLLRRRLEGIEGRLRSEIEGVTIRDLV